MSAEKHEVALAMSEAELIKVLESSLYPGAASNSISMVIGYCKTAGLDPMQKPVHIVPLWDSKAGRMRDVIMPGVGLYRIQAARTNQYAGVSEPEFGPDITENIGGVEITYPQWCKVSVKRRLISGEIVEFPAVERWKENYAVKGGKEKSIAPNAMWAKRPYGQINKCAEAQALRKAFPELGAAPTAEEMEGKSLNEDAIEGTYRTEKKPTKPATQPVYSDERFQRDHPRMLAEAVRQPPAADDGARAAMVAELEQIAQDQGIDAYAARWSALTAKQRKSIGAEEHTRLKALAQSVNTIEGEDVPVTEELF